MQVESEQFIYILVKDYRGQPKGHTISQRITQQDLIDPGEKEDFVIISSLGKIQDLNLDKDVVYRDEVVPEIEPDSYSESNNGNIDDYREHKIRVMEITRAN